MDHLEHSHDHAHDHGGGHHHHHHDPHAEETLEQLLTVGICGAFGVVALLLGWNAISTGTGMLKIILAKPFWVWVLVGGGILLVLTLVRAIALWKTAGKEQDCCHDHGHDHMHSHSHDHSHEHSHGGVFWRAVVLMFPIVLFMLNLPNTGFSEERIQKLLGADMELGEIKEVKTVAGDAMTFNDIADAMRDEKLMEARNGRFATVKGKLRKMNDREFTLYTEKMTCCMADMVPLKARIIVLNDDFGGSLSSKGLKNGEWLEVSGVLQFVKLPNSEQYLPVIRAKLMDIRPTTPE